GRNCRLLPESNGSWTDELSVVGLDGDSVDFGSIVVQADQALMTAQCPADQNSDNVGQLSYADQSAWLDDSLEATKRARTTTATSQQPEHVQPSVTSVRQDLTSVTSRYPEEGRWEDIDSAASVTRLVRFKLNFGPEQQASGTESVETEEGAVTTDSECQIHSQTARYGWTNGGMAKWGMGHAVGTLAQSTGKNQTAKTLRGLRLIFLAVM
ncbi:hypothetical protein BaRGS_00037410, partial [Batillaria attramentaria]